LPDRDWVLAGWNQALDDLERDPDRAADRIDWVAKRRLLADYRHAVGPGVGCAALQSLDLAYHDVRPEFGLFHVLADRGALRRVVTEEAVARAVLEAPNATRAFVRGHFVRRHPEAVSAIGWNGIAFRRGDEEMVFDMNGLVDGRLGPLNRELAMARTLDQTSDILRRYRGSIRIAAGAPQGNEV
jgi:proteasome accessory factor A